MDVYEWREGRIQLVSNGTTEAHTVFAAASEDGQDVFFNTRQQLVGQDRDELYDLYDARVGGGIASQSPPPPPDPCLGEACKEAPAPAPTPQVLGSPAFRGTGNISPGVTPKPRGCKGRKVRRKGRCVRPEQTKAHKTSKRGARR
jgi:hypothetical protein